MKRLGRLNDLFASIAYVGLMIGLPVSLGQSCSPATTPPPDQNNGGTDNGGTDNGGADNGGNTGGDTGGNTGGNTGGDTGGDTGGNNECNNNNPLPAVGEELTIPPEGTAKGLTDDALHENDHHHFPPSVQVTYEHNPPASGPHWSTATPPAPAPHGFYSDSNALDEEQWVHNLEHAYVVILYDCKGVCSPSLLSSLQAFANEVPNSSNGYPKIIITPYSCLPYQIMAIAWHTQLNLQSFDHDRLLAFYNAHMGICDDCELTAP